MATAARRFSKGDRVAVGRLGDLAGSFERRGLAADAVGVVVAAADPEPGKRSYLEVDFGAGEPIFVAPSRLRRARRGA